MSEAIGSDLPWLQEVLELAGEQADLLSDHDIEFLDGILDTVDAVGAETVLTKPALSRIRRIERRLKSAEGLVPADRVWETG